MNLCLQKESEWENTNEEVVGSCDWDKGRVYAKEGKGILIIKRRERRDVWVHWIKTEEGIHQTLKVISNSTYIFCGEER